MCLFFSLYPCVLLLFRSPSCFKGEANPLFYLQLRELMFLCFLPCLSGKACLFVSTQTSLLLFLRFQPYLFNKACLLFSL